MRKIRDTPSQERLLELFVYDPETGIFTRRIDRHKWKSGQVVGTLAGGYISINVDYTIYRAHRLAWTYMTGEQPPKGIDHINGIPTDNRWDNLRPADQTENACNKKAQRNSQTGMKGISKASCGGSFVARVNIRGKKHYLGCYKTKEEAKAARDAAAQIIHGEFFRS